ncbi:Gfo/Idh/MocA family oxidoreductase [Pedobacter sp. Du54]|uniref:Gfo/Idh/MocA family protein n=1 Tax=Pedobacter anseongensis TaxID=3133439 RepID=UPI00309FF3E6
MNNQTTAISIIIIGAGAVVQTGHLPAYHLAGFTVRGIFDLDIEKAFKVAKQFNISKVYASIEEIIFESDDNVIFDIAIPASGIIPVLEQLPPNAAILLQKPMGEDLTQAVAIAEICRKKKFIAGVNFQLRYAPFILKAKELIEAGKIGDLYDIEININVSTPWHLWDFLYGLPRMEILYHSIHYIDLVRSFLGDPKTVFAKTIKHPKMPELTSVRSVICMDYGDYLRANILTNHCHQYGVKHQQSYIKIEGTNGAIYIKMGLLLDYPNGVLDIFEYITTNNEQSAIWQSIDIKGSWFPEAFIGSMSEIIHAVQDKKYVPDNNIEDCLNTMVCTEAAYIANLQSGIAIEGLIR